MERAMNDSNRRTLTVILAVVGVLSVCGIFAFVGGKLLVSGLGEFFDEFTDNGDGGLSDVTITPQLDVTDRSRKPPGS
jgi:hypothetical protein